MITKTATIAIAYAVLVATANAEGTLLTCTHLDGKGYTVAGNFPEGWSEKRGSQQEYKLVISNAGAFDILSTNAGHTYSRLKDGCSVVMLSSGGANLDMNFHVTCKDTFETYSFYVRDGKKSMILTSFTNDPLVMTGAVAVSHDCTGK
jgi:hypothetical protein